METSTSLTIVESRREGLGHSGLRVTVDEAAILDQQTAERELLVCSMQSSTSRCAA